MNKFCKDCKHYLLKGKSNQCIRGKELNKVTGKYNYLNCEVERICPRSVGCCSPNGDFFKKKEKKKCLEKKIKP